MKNSVDERIGFKMEDSKLSLILPKFIKEKDYSEDKELKEKIKYFKLFRKYNTFSKESKSESLYKSENTASEEYIYSIFEAYYLLFIDYMEMGLFLFTERKTNRKQRGRLNWNRTINKSNLIVAGDNLIYDNPYYKNRNILYNHPLTVLYGIHLLEIEAATEIKININSHYKNIIKNNKRNININEVLKKYKYSMYSDRERKVFNILESINRNTRKLDKKETDLNLHYLENLNNLWEHMLKNILDDQYHEFNNCFPKGRYNLEIEDESYNPSGISIIPDLIREYKGKLYIIDAKNYLPHINKNMPTSADINKQIIYRLFLSKEFNDKNKYKLEDIKNIFLLPNDLEGKIIRKIGIHEFENVENEIGDIFIYQVDFDSVLEAYLDKKKGVSDEILKRFHKISSQI